MTKRQFRVLYREFLFRLVDRDLLSANAQGDASKLLGRISTILILVSIPFAFTVAGINNHLPGRAVFLSAWGPEHSLIATTMLLVGVLNVLSWDAAYPDRRDAHILSPLPIKASTIFLAKLAAIGAATAVTVTVFNAPCSLLLPFALAPATDTPLDMLVSPSFYHHIAAYWLTVLAAGAFVLFSILAVQGIAGQLPRRIFLRLSAALQLVTLVACVAGYFVEPPLASPKALEAVQNQHWLALLPTYWFFGLYQELSGPLPGVARPELIALADRACIALLVVVFTAGAVFVLSYVRTLRKIVEEPDIVSKNRTWLPSFGNSLATAITQFSIRSLLRSRRHRVLLSFYAGIGFAVVVLFVKTPVVQILSSASAKDPWYQISLPWLASSFVMLGFWLLGMRIVFGIPLELRANWIFRTTKLRPTAEYLQGVRRSAYVLGLAPVWLACATLFLSIWQWQSALEHLLVVGLLGITLTELWLRGVEKIPFTCSYLPGASQMHITFILCLMLGLNITFESANFERRALVNWKLYAAIVGILSLAALCARLLSIRAMSEKVELKFEEEELPVIAGLGLHRDGIMLLK